MSPLILLSDYRHTMDGIHQQLIIRITTLCLKLKIELFFLLFLPLSQRLELGHFMRLQNRSFI
jgi:hypothetical protein